MRPADEGPWESLALRRESPRFVVEKVFQLAGRGCVLVPGFSFAAQPVRVGSPIRLERPDGSLIRSVVRGLEMVDGPAINKGAAPISLPSLLKASDVPPGTVVELEDASFLFEVRSCHRLAGVGFALEPGTKRALVTSTLLLVSPDGMGSVASTCDLIFNEGYVASSGADVHRVELSNEALRVTRLLRRLLPDDPEVGGLLALMLLTDARRDARTGPAGELIPLDQQDRSRWNREAIEEGSKLISKTFAIGAVGSYQVQAAIAALHDEATSTETTDWPQILGLYAVLLRMNDNPMVALSHAVALAMVQGPAAALERVDELATDSRLAGSHRLDATRAHLLERAGRREEAIVAFDRAAKRTTSIAERDYLLLQAARLRE